MKWQDANAHIFMLRRIWQHDKSMFMLTLVRIPLDVLAGFINVYLTSVIVGIVMTGQTKQLLGILFFFAALKLSVSAGTYWSEQQLADKNYNLKMRFISDYAAKYMQTDYANIESADGKDRAQRAKNTMFGFDYRAKPVVEAYVTHISQMLGQVCGLFAYGGVISVLNPVILIVLVVTAGVTYLFQKCMVLYDRRDRLVYIPIERKLHYLMREAKNFKAAKDVKMYGLDNWFTGIFDEQIEERIRLYKKRGKFSLSFRTAIMLINTVFNGFVYIYLIYQYMEAGLDIQSFILYFGMITGFNTWLLNFIGSVEGLQRFGFHIEDLKDFLTQDEVSEDNEAYSEGDNEEVSDSCIEFDNVSYQYGENQKSVINNISFKVKAGEKIAVVGVNGEGKTTLIKLMCGLYTPTSGTVRIGGKDVRKMEKEALFKRFAVVFQDIYMLPASIERNIALQKDIDPKKMQEVLMLSGLQEKIERLSEKEGTVLLKSVREDAVDLSGGEIQKLAHARALYKGGDIMILDEPTAALDPIAEKEMYSRYNELTEGKTSVFISHRLSSTRFCDRILFLENGKVAECGTHEELMALQGRYAEMYQVQSHYYQDEVLTERT